MYYIYYTIANFSKVFGIWFVLTILNQLIFFGACLQPYCILASVPHISVITAIIVVISAKDDEEAKERADELSIKADLFWSFLFKWIIIGSIGFFIILFLYGKFMKEESISSIQNISNSTSSNIDTLRQEQIDYCVKTTGGWQFSRIGNDIVCRANNSSYKKHSLTISTSPSNARVQIMNIKPVYYDGIKLNKGRYDIRVSKKGYKTENFYIDFAEDSTYSSTLERKY